MNYRFTIYIYILYRVGVSMKILENSVTFLMKRLVLQLTTEINSSTSLSIPSLLKQQMVQDNLTKSSFPENQPVV